MLKSLLLVLSLFAFATFANPFYQQFTPETNVTNTTTPDTSFNNIDSQVRDIVWCSEQKNVIFLLSEKLTLYRSVDSGSNFVKLGKNELIGARYDVGQVASIIQSPADKNIMIFLGTEGLNWVTTDCGTTYKVWDQGRPVDEFQFHPTEKNWILASAWTLCEDFPAEPCRKYKELFVTKNLGGEWEAVAGDISQFSWAKYSECTEEDWQCDDGFMRILNGPCVPVDDEFDTTMNAPKECTDSYEVTSGYRKIEGNNCDGGVNHSPLRLPCPEEGVLASIARALGFTW